MLNKFLKFFSVIFFSSFLNSMDISSFDIEGIKLGDYYNDIKHKLPCSNIEEGYKTDSGKVVYFAIECKYKHEKLELQLDNKYKVMFIGRKITFSDAPNWNKLKRKIIAKYGTPLQTATTGVTDSQGLDSSSYKTMLYWGNNRVEKSFNYGKHYTGYSLDIPFANNQRYLTVTMKVFTGGSLNEDIHLDLTLLDQKIYKKNDQWKKQENERYKKKIESNIKF